MNIYVQHKRDALLRSLGLSVGRNFVFCVCICLSLFATIGLSCNCFCFGIPEVQVSNIRKTARVSTLFLGGGGWVGMGGGSAIYSVIGYNFNTY